ncbi:MAG: hypothetical protein IKN84_01070 [Bacteroidales bacterium]|jgi:hypothetical protein|nr:hypothetical protein [Bacteroidales bacterium]
MKKFFAMAAIAFMTLFAVSCGSDDEQESFVGSKWNSTNAISYMGQTGSFDLNMNVLSQDSLQFGIDITFMGRTESMLDNFAYTLDNDQNLTIYESDGNMNLTYDKGADTYTMLVDEAEAVEMLGMDKVTFHRVK